MAEFGINFHATPGEIIEWVREWMHTENVHVVATYHGPFYTREIFAEEIEEVMAEERVWRLSFIAEEPDTTPKYQSDFDDAHCDQMILVLGKLSTDGLGESWISCRTDNLETFAIWKRIAKNLRSNTKNGVSVINKEYNAWIHNKSRRYSAGAKSLEDNGTEMIPIQGLGGPRLRLGILDKDK